MNKPVIIAYFDGDEEGKILSHFAWTPFELDGIKYNTVEGFWQSLKTEIPVLREKIGKLDGLAAKQAANTIKRYGNSANIFTYQDKLYSVGSQAHHILLERANRAKYAQCEEARQALIATKNRPLKHMLKNKFNQWRLGNSPALPAITFERMLEQIRTELLDGTFEENLPLPNGINDFV